MSPCRSGQIWGHTPEQSVVASTLRRYSLGLRLAIDQADARSVMPASFRLLRFVRSVKTTESSACRKAHCLITLIEHVPLISKQTIPTIIISPFTLCASIPHQKSIRNNNTTGHKLCSFDLVQKNRVTTYPTYNVSTLVLPGSRFHVMENSRSGYNYQ